MDPNRSNEPNPNGNDNGWSFRKAMQMREQNISARLQMYAQRARDRQQRRHQENTAQLGQHIYNTRMVTENGVMNGNRPAWTRSKFISDFMNQDQELNNYNTVIGYSGQSNRQSHTSTFNQCQ